VPRFCPSLALSRRAVNRSVSRSDCASSRLRRGALNPGMVRSTEAPLPPAWRRRYCHIRTAGHRLRGCRNDAMAGPVELPGDATDVLRAVAYDSDVPVNPATGRSRPFPASSASGNCP
jgi:hypothetical protein